MPKFKAQKNPRHPNLVVMSLPRGAILRRQWRGQVIEVKVVRPPTRTWHGVFVWEGRKFTSLTGVVRAIVGKGSPANPRAWRGGAQWFGLTKAPPKKRRL